MPSLQTASNSHYDKIAAQYDGVPLLSDDKARSTILSLVREHIDLDPNLHQYAEIGAGNCWLTHSLMKNRVWKHPMYCVEPSTLIDQCDSSENIAKFQMGALEFSKLSNIHLDRALFVCCVHHFKDDWEEVFTNTHSQLNANGKILIYARLDVCTYPWFKAVNDMWVGTNDVEMTKVLRKAGYSDVKVEIKRLQHVLPVEDWFNMLRIRFFSTLSTFADDEIEVEIQRLQSGKLKEKNTVQIDDPIVIITAAK